MHRTNRYTYKYNVNIIFKVFLKFLLFSIVLTTAIYNDIQLLFEFPVAVGLDGYYYVLQIDNLMRGELFFHNQTPLVLYFLTAISYLVGNTIIGIKIGAIILNILLGMGVLGILLKSTKDWLLSILGFGCVTLTGLHFFMIAEFINNLGALTFIILGLFCISCALHNKKYLWLSLAIVCLLISVLCHRSGVFLILILTIAYCWTYFLQTSILTKNTKLVFSLLALAIILYFLPYLLLSQTFIEVPQIIQNEFALNLQWSVTPIVFNVIIVCLSVPLITILKFWYKLDMQNRFNILYLTIAFSSAFLCLNVFVDSSFAFGIIGRLQIIIYIGIALFVPYLMWLVKKVSTEYIWYTLAVFVPLFLFNTQTGLPIGLQTAYLIDREKIIRALTENTFGIPPNSVVIAPHGNQFVITYFTGIKSQNSLPKEIDSQPVYWMLNDVPQSFAVSRKILITNNQGNAIILIRNEDMKLFWVGLDSMAKQKILNSNLQLKEIFSELSSY